MSDRIVLVPDNPGGTEEEWERLSERPSGWDSVWAYRDEDRWDVAVRIAEMVVTQPLEGEFYAAMEAALRAVPGAERVWHEDREVWIVIGSLSGRTLLVAACAVVDSFLERIFAQTFE